MAIYSDAFDSAYNGSWATLYLEVTEESQSVVNNTTTLKCVLKVKKTTTCTSNKGSGANIYMTINGTKLYSADSFTIKTLAVGSTKTFATKYITVPHNADGTKSVSCVAYFYSAVNLGTASINKTFTCTSIPRVSSLALDVSTVPADGTTQVIATATKKSSSFTDTLTITLGSYSKTLTSGTAFTIPMEWINAISGTSAKATVKVTTKSGSTTIGSKTASLTITVPSSVVPTISGVDISEAVEAVTKAFGNRYIQNVSQLNVEVDASGVYGSTIKSYQVSLDGVNYIQRAFTSNVIKTAGKLTIKVKVTDSRNRTAEDTFEVTVIEYVKPIITSMTYIHCDSDGTQNSSGECTKITIAGKVYSVEELNTKALKLKYKPTTDETYTERVVDIPNWTFNVDVIIGGTDPTVTYEYIAELTDKINVGLPETSRVTTGIVVISRLAGGKGITMFEEASQEGFVVGNGKPAKFTGDVIFDNAANVRKNLGLLGAYHFIEIIKDGSTTDFSSSYQYFDPLQTISDWYVVGDSLYSGSYKFATYGDRSDYTAKGIYVGANVKSVRIDASVRYLNNESDNTVISTFLYRIRNGTSTILGYTTGNYGNERAVHIISALAGVQEGDFFYLQSYKGTAARNIDVIADYKSTKMIVEAIR